MRDKKTDIEPELWPSVARMIATFGIFVFHYFSLLGKAQHRLDFYSIMLFCFISGYLAKINTHNRSSWFIKRYFSIMIPYWFVIIPVVATNQIYHYKQVTYLSVIVTIIGGNLFLNNPVYVIAWYITFILLIYVYAVLETAMPAKGKIFFMVISTAAFSIVFHKGLYFVAFILGSRISFWAPVERTNNRTPAREALVNTFLSVQKYCYPFFLVHGAVFIFLLHHTSVSLRYLFEWAFILSALSSKILYEVTKPIEIYATRKTSAMIKHCLVS